jgi:ABC-type branched-subunit amino acid transport system substrate-binding protein/streptogramin lyase
MSAVIAPGATFAGYHIESLVGRGGMGVVYRAADLSLDRPVALKLIAPELAQDERFRARFLKEQRLAAALDHPNVVPIHDAGEHDGQLYLAMRFVEGSDLKTLLGGGLEPQRALELLAQIADALDAAHRRGLVHRDVKPGNVLVDEDGHAYLTDFGITKRLGTDSTDTGGLVGTLDYLAPEQVRGEPVDGRTDGYALACILYEAVAGSPPFRRATEAETLWGHLHDDPPQLARLPSLDPVVRRGLAKEQDARYPTCAELIEAARAALGGAGAGPGAKRRRGAPAGLGSARRRRLLMAAGVLVLGAATAGAIGALTGGGVEGDGVPIGNGVAALDASGAGITSFVASATAPSNIAVGEGAVWFLNSENRTVSRLDPETKAITGRFEPRRVPTSIAAGEGALWLGNGGGSGANYTVSVSRVDPRTTRVTRTVKLPDRTGEGAIATFSWGHPDIVVGAGGVWTRNPDHSVSRLDPESGDLIATIDVEADSIAAGPEGVWAVSGSDIMRIDPRTNRARRVLTLDGDGTSIAVGAGDVWVSSANAGVLWRIEPGPDPVARSIAVGPGVEYVAYGAGAVWVGNFVDGTVSRIDPRTNAVARVPVGAVQSLAAGAGGAWVSTAGRPRAGTLPADVCDQVVSGGREPDVLIASDLPLQGPNRGGPRAIGDAIRLVLEQRDYTAGRFSVGYRSCDDSTAQTGAFEQRRCAANATAFARAERLVAVIGPYNSNCAQVEIPILNRAPGGPLAMISPANTHPGLTRRGPPSEDGFNGEPEIYYPTGIRNFVRVVPGDDLQAAAFAVFAKRRALDGVYLLDQRGSFFKDDLIDPFRRAAGKLGVPITGATTYDARSERFDELADAIARSGADGVVLGGDPYDGGDRLLKALRARLGARVTIMASFFFFPRDTLKRAGRAALGTYMTTSDLARATFKPTAAGRRFARDVGDSATQYLGVLEAGQATELLLDAIARSDGTRASVLRELKATEVKDGILGSFRFDANGDITTAAYPILRITGATPPDVELPTMFRGAVIDRVVDVPASLVD